MLIVYNGLESLVELFTKGMDNASTVGTDRPGADGSFVDFNQQIEVSKRIRAILLCAVPNVVRCRI